MARFKVQRQARRQSTPQKRRKRKPFQPKKQLATKAPRNAAKHLKHIPSSSRKGSSSSHHVITNVDGEGNEDDEEGQGEEVGEENDDDKEHSGSVNEDQKEDDNISQQDVYNDQVYKPVVKIKGIGKPCVIESFVLEQHLNKDIVSSTQNYGVKLARVGNNTITNKQSRNNDHFIVKSIDSIVKRFGHDTAAAFLVKCELVKKYEMDYNSTSRETLIPSNICVSCQSKSFLSCSQHHNPYCFYCYQKANNGIAAQSNYLDLPIMDSCPCNPLNTIVYRQKAMFCSVFKFFPSNEINAFVSFAEVLRDSILCGGFVEYDWRHIAGKKQNSKNFMSKLHDIIQTNIQPICATGSQRLWHIFAFHTRSNMVCFGDGSENSIDAFLHNIIRQLHTWVAQHANFKSEHLTEIIGCDLESMMSTLVKLGTQPNQFVLLFTKSTPFDSSSTFTSTLRKYWHDLGMPMLQAYECALTEFNLDTALLIQFSPNKEAFTIFFQKQETQRCIVRQKYINGTKDGNVEILKVFQTSTSSNEIDQVNNTGNHSQKDKVMNSSSNDIATVTSTPATSLHTCPTSSPREDETKISSSSSSPTSNINTTPHCNPIKQRQTICRHFVSGRCVEGVACRFIHNLSTVPNTTDSNRTNSSSSPPSESINKQHDSNVSHPSTLLSSQQPPQQKQQRQSKRRFHEISKEPCRFYLKGKCKRTMCKFSHNTEPDKRQK